MGVTRLVDTSVRKAAEQVVSMGGFDGREDEKTVKKVIAYLYHNGGETRVTDLLTIVCGSDIGVRDDAFDEFASLCREDGRGGELAKLLAVQYLQEVEGGDSDGTLPDYYLVTMDSLLSDVPDPFTAAMALACDPDGQGVLGVLTHPNSLLFEKYPSTSYWVGPFEDCLTRCDWRGAWGLLQSAERGLLQYGVRRPRLDEDHSLSDPQLRCYAALPLQLEDMVNRLYRAMVEERLIEDLTNDEYRMPVDLRRSFAGKVFIGRQFCADEISSKKEAVLLPVARRVMRVARYFARLRSTQRRLGKSKPRSAS